MLTTLTASATVSTDSTSEVRVRSLRPRQIDGLLQAQWRDLEHRALEANAFLSPHLIQPALKHLTPQADVQILVFEVDTEIGPDVVGIGAFEYSSGTKVAPFPHMCAYVAPMSTFLTSLLVDQGRSGDVLQAFFEYAERQGGPWSCVEFTQRTTQSAFGGQLEDMAANFGYDWLGWSFERPVFRPRQLTAENVEQSLSKNRRKKVRRYRKQLQSRGDLSFRIIRDSADMNQEAENFLRLEHAGWKGDQGDSVASGADTTAFFREMVDGFVRDERMIFTELSLDDQVIGSTSNFISGSAGFAWKSGWDPELRDFSPGMLQEVELARAARDELSDLNYFDSGTDMDSWVESLWPDRRTITSGVFVSSWLARVTVNRMLQLRRWKRRLKGRSAE